MMIFRRLGGRIFVTFAVSLMLLSTVYGGLASHFGRKMVLESSSNEMRVLAIVLSQLIQKQFSSLENSLETIRENEIVIRSLEYGVHDTTLLPAYLFEQRARYQIFEDLMIYNKDGRCIGATDPDWYKISGKSSAFFKDGLEEFNFPAIYGTDSAGKVQLVSSPIYDASDNVIGVIVGIIRLNAVYDLMDQKIGLNENRDAFLVDADLRFITPGKAGPQELVESHLGSTALKEHLRDDSWVGQYNNYDGVEVLGTALKIPGYSWYVVIERKYEGVVQKVTALERIVILVSVGLLVMFVIASLLLSRSITQPLLQLVKSTRAIGAGNFQEPIKVIGQIEEVEFLAAEFERMRRRVAQSQERLKERLEVSEALRVESERLAAIGTLASSLAHEIRNPLNAMSLLLSRLRGQIKDETRNAVVEDLFGEVGRLDRLVNSILDYAKPVYLERKAVDIQGVITSALELYGELFKQRQIHVVVHASPTPCMVEIDEDKVKQCLVNSFQNAIEAMNGGGQLLLAWSKAEDTIVLEVGDTGEGIPDGILKKLFSPFYTTKQFGTGLGLSNIQKIISAHGGHVEILSVDQLGTNAQWRTILRMTLPVYN